MDTKTEYRIRMAGAADAAVIAHHRVEMFQDMGLLDSSESPMLEASSREYLGNALATGAYLGWLIECGNCVVAGGGLIVRPLLPCPGSPQGSTEAYILNVYTEPAHRRRGLARQLTSAMLGWCRDRGIPRVALHASDDGRPLYESLGFTATNEMRREQGRNGG